MQVYREWCAFVSTLSILGGEQFFMIFNQASYHEKQRAKRLTRSKPSYLFFYQPPRFHSFLALMLVEEYRKPSSKASLHNFDIVDR